MYHHHCSFHLATCLRLKSSICSGLWSMLSCKIFAHSTICTTFWRDHVSSTSTSRFSAWLPRPRNKSLHEKYVCDSVTIEVVCKQLVCKASLCLSCRGWSTLNALYLMPYTGSYFCVLGTNSSWYTQNSCSFDKLNLRYTSPSLHWFAEPGEEPGSRCSFSWPTLAANMWLRWWRLPWLVSRDVWLNSGLDMFVQSLGVWRLAYFRAPVFKTYISCVGYCRTFARSSKESCPTFSVTRMCISIGRVSSG